MRRQSFVVLLLFLLTIPLAAQQRGPSDRAKERLNRHIVVKNGNATLERVVANEGDKNIANLQARGVPGVFSVTNNLRVEK